MVEVATLRTLLATPPADFVAARNDLAKALKADGDRDGSEAVKALRRLGVADWALNVAAGEEPEVAAAFGDAATDVLDAQDEAMAGRGGGGDLRARMKTLRARSADLVAAAAAVAERHGQRGAGSSTIELGSRLGEIGANRAAIDLLRDALLGAADPGVADPFGVVGGASPETAPPKARTGRAAARGAAKATRAAPAGGQKAAQASTAGRTTADVVERGELERRRAERRARADAEQAAKTAAASLAAAEAALTKAQAVAAKAAVRVADAEVRLAELVAAREVADAAAVDAADAHRRAEVEAERAAQALR